ncbi:MAG: tRNA (adenosine(37)-N6)-dimethylallyltransferase MiaA [Verrucomicrobiota bacterium]|nr:tRNA (adenosine(37)-N6)-dimethylallyltransferase MiaA [Verrucomicrobiota bacterium]
MGKSRRKSAAIVAKPAPCTLSLLEKPKKRKVLVIGGPTASGKSKLSLELAQLIGGEILSVDSCQVYRGMDIGTAKPTAEERSLITHHLVDVCDLTAPYNVAHFCSDAKKALHEIIARDNVPIAVGGSGFYLRTLLYGPPSGPPSHPEIRAKLEQQINELGAEVLYERLQILDPTYAATISERDRHKIVRALEIIALSEKKVSEFPKSASLQEEEYDFRCWFIYYPREELYRRIETRCDEMIAQGLIEEVSSLEKVGLRENSTAAGAIGYRQTLQYLDSGKTKEDLANFISLFKRASRHCAKKQFTWFRKEPLFRWLNCQTYSQNELIEIILRDFEQDDS